MIFFTYMMFFTVTSTLLLFHHWFELDFVLSNLYLPSHDICLVNVSNSFIPVIMLSTLRFKSSVLFGTHTLESQIIGGVGIIGGVWTGLKNSVGGFLVLVC